MMMRNCRAWRVTAAATSYLLFGFVAVVMALLIALLVLPLPIAIDRKRRWTRKTIKCAAWVYIRIVRVLDLITFQVIDIDQLVQPGTLVVANHLTLLDAVYLMSTTSRAVFIVKAAIIRNPFMSGMAYLAGYIPNSESGTDLVTKAVKTLKAKQILIVFPEGTRASSTNEFDFKRGAANIALQAHCPIQPLFIRCQPVILRKQQKWHEVPATSAHLEIKALPLIHAAEHIDPAQPPGKQARLLTQHLQSLYLHEAQSDITSANYEH